MKKSKCHADRVNDQYICGRCGLQWDVKDDDPPRCLTKSQIKRKKVQQARNLSMQRISELLT